MSQDLYRPTLDTVEDVRAWMRSWTPLGGFPHPDDSAWLTCEQEVALGFGEAHAAHPSHDEGGHLAIVGPAAPTTKEDALAYDASLTRAHELVSAAGLDIYQMALDATKDTLVVYARLVFRLDEPFTREQIVEGVEARLGEVYVNGWPAIPEVTIIDGPDLD